MDQIKAFLTKTVTVGGIVVSYWGIGAAALVVVGIVVAFTMKKA